MVKVLKFIGRALGLVSEWVVLIIIILAFLIRASFFQTWLAQQATAYLSKELKTKIYIGKVDLVPFDRIYLDELWVQDKARRDLLKIQSLELVLESINLNKNRAVVKQVLLRKGQVWVCLNKNSEMNFQFIADYFSSDKPSKPSKPFTVELRKISLVETDVRYDDFRKSQLDFGLDYDHIEIKKLNLSLSDFYNLGPLTEFHIDHLSLKDKSGLHIKHLEASMKIHEHGLKISNLILKLNHSNLKAKEVSYAYKNDSDLDDFSNKVQWIMDIKPSSVNLADVAYFVPEMKGMTDQVAVSGVLRNTINRLKIKDLKLRLKTKTFVNGDFDIPNFSDLKAFGFSEHIRSAHIDFKELQALKMPDGQSSIELGDIVNRLNYLDLNDFKLVAKSGILELKPTQINTALGQLGLLNSLVCDEFGDQLSIHAKNPELSTFHLNQIQLGQILDNQSLGLVDGKIGFNTFTLQGNDYQLSGASGLIDTLFLDGYNYQNISLKSLDIKNEMAQVKLDVGDQNLNLDLDGKIDLSGANNDISLHLNTINLDDLGYSLSNNMDISGSVKLVSHGKSYNDLDLGVELENVSYTENGKSIKVSIAKIDVYHHPENDHLKLRSPLLNLDLSGVFDMNTIADEMLYEVHRVLPTLVQAKAPSSKPKNSQFKLELEFKDLTDVFAIFVPDLQVNPGTTADINFSTLDNIFSLELKSDRIQFQDVLIENLSVIQRINKDGAMLVVDANNLSPTDSLTFKDIYFVTTGNGGKLMSKLTWDTYNSNLSRIQWSTQIHSPEHFDFNFYNSLISLNGFKWNIMEQSKIAVADGLVKVSDFEFSRTLKNQSIRIDGQLSEKLSDKLEIQLTQLDLEDISQMLKLGTDLEGKLSGSVSLNGPFDAIKVTANTNLSNFYLDHQEVGDFAFTTDYIPQSKSIKMKGGLAFRGIETLEFFGQYLLDSDKDNLSLYLLFKNTDLAFVNAFMDPELVQKIEGKLNGQIDVKGTPDNPELKGLLRLDKTSLFMPLLGCKYVASGKIDVKPKSFEISGLQLKDIDGNLALLEAKITHNNFSNINYLVDMNFEEPAPALAMFSNKTSKFMLLNTKYKEGELYYGKVYGSGNLRIKGSPSKTDIQVQAKTRPGSKIIFPMYGSSELEDDVDFIQFVSKKKESVEVKEKVSYTGLDLKMTFNITPDAELKLVFNEQTQDEIKAFTQGILNFSLNEYDLMSLDGSLNIQPGSLYNFAVGPYRKPFQILPGSSLTWSGDIYKADLNLVTAYPLKNINMLELSPEQNDNSLQNQEVLCLLKLTDKLDAPKVSFEISAPSAPETGKSLINGINADKDETNRQFFSLMLFNKFQPLRGNVSADGAAAYDLVANQINSALSQLSKSYEVKMDLGSSNVSTSVQKSFLNNRLIVSGSFGVASGTDAQASATGGLVGDLSVEYLVNEKGTFRINAFNESNNNTAKQNAGPFTQGVGLSYHEDFDGWKDFVLFQSFLDVFRPKENRVVKVKRKKRQTKLPDLIPDLPLESPNPTINDKKSNE